MSLKDTIISFLFGSKAGAPPEQNPSLETESSLPEPSEAPQERGPEISCVELPPEHALYRLYEMRRQEAGRLPAPRLSLDKEGLLPPEMVRREQGRLRGFLNSTCNARLKQIQRAGTGKSKKKAPEEEGEAPVLALDALPCFFLSADKLYAWVLVLPPAGEGAELSLPLLRRALAAQNISYGVDERLVARLSQKEERYFHLFLLARGKPAFDGRNGNIIDRFPRVLERLLTVDEYDRVDYSALNLICNVKEGEEICRLILPTEGEPGRTVLDQEIPAKSGRAVPLPRGRNTEISQDGVSLLASMAGHVEFSGRSFQVKPVLDIPGDVDFSTGSINFLGDVNIQGDVLSGFSVRAMGSIQVAGVVEAGSTVEAGGDLVVVKGILGDGTTIIRSQRSVFSKYIENATICVRENLQTDCIVNGNIYSGGQVCVQSGRGTIMGGRIWAAQKISAKAVGSQLEGRTSIILGGSPCKSFERESVLQELRGLERELERLENQLDSTVKSSLLDKTRMRLSVAELKLQQLESDLTEDEADEERDSGRLECSIAYPGTELRFGQETLRLRQIYRQCVAKLVCGEIVLM